MKKVNIEGSLVMRKSYTAQICAIASKLKKDEAIPIAEILKRVPVSAGQLGRIINSKKLAIRLVVNRKITTCVAHPDTVKAHALERAEA